MTRQLTFALVLLLVGAPGCLGTRHGRPEKISNRDIEEFSRSDTPQPTHWVRVLIGAPKPKVRGYVKSLRVDERRREAGHIHFVYDPDFRLVGRVSSTGTTMRIDLKGNERDEGHYSLEHACLLLLGGGRDEEIKLASMPDPRG